MADVPLETLIELLGPDVVRLGILLAGGLVLAYLATVVLPEIRLRRAGPATAGAAIGEIDPPRAAPRPAAPPVAVAQWSRVSHALSSEIERSHAIAGYQEAAARQVDAVEFALLGLYSELAGVSSHARARVQTMHLDESEATAAALEAAA